MSCILSLEQ